MPLLRMKGIRQAWTGAVLNKLRFKVTLLNKCRPRWDWSEQKFLIWDSFKGTNSECLHPDTLPEHMRATGHSFPPLNPQTNRTALLIDFVLFKFCDGYVCTACFLKPISCEQPPTHPFSTASSFCLDSERLICLQLQLWPLRLLSAYACDWGPPSRKAIWDHEQWGSLGLETKWRALGKTESI